MPFLRDSAYDDFSTINDVINKTIYQIQEKCNLEFDNVASLQVTCPLNNNKIIKEVYDDFCKSKADVMCTCFEFGFMNPWWAFKMTENKEADFLLSCPAKSRSQDNPTLYCPSGAVNFSKLNTENISKVIYHPIDWKYAIDIDNYEDIELAKAVYILQKSEACNA